MQISNDSDRAIAEALDELNEMSSQATDGKWLEQLVVNVGPHIKEWDLSECFLWKDWHEREQQFPGVKLMDVGIDVVGRRRNGEHIAIQCKARQVDEHGRGAAFTKKEIDSFAHAAESSFWEERWLVTNGSGSLSSPLESAGRMQDKPIKWIYIASDLQRQQPMIVDESCPHCEPNPNGEFRKQTKNCMQREAVAASVRHSERA